MKKHYLILKNFFFIKIINIKNKILIGLNHYKSLFNYNAFLVISDGVTTKVGTLTSKIDRYNEWKSINGEKGYDELEEG